MKNVIAIFAATTDSKRDMRTVQSRCPAGPTPARGVGTPRYLYQVRRLPHEENQNQSLVKSVFNPRSPEVWTSPRRMIGGDSVHPASLRKDTPPPPKNIS